MYVALGKNNSQRTNNPVQSALFLGVKYLSNMAKAIGMQAKNKFQAINMYAILPDNFILQAKRTKQEIQHAANTACN